jgi:hypothetical protein
VHSNWWRGRFSCSGLLQRRLRDEQPFLNQS